MHFQRQGLGGIVGFLRLQQKRKIGDHVAHPLRQFKSGCRIELPGFGKPHVRDDAEQIVAIAVDNLHRFLISLRQQDFRPQPHPQQAVAHVHRMLHQITGLCQNLGINDRQNPRIVNRRVLDQQNRLNPLPAIGFDIVVVFDIFDNRQQDLAVAGPVEHPVDTGVLPDLDNHFRRQPIVRQHHDRNRRIGFIDRFFQDK